MLLVDDDEPDVGDRREDRRARADADLRLAGAQPVPLVAALPGRELGVQDGDGVPEAVDEARDDLRRQRDLGHEHDRAAPLGERRGGGLQVDLRLARAGDAVQQQARRIARRDRRLDLGEGDRLVGGQLRLRPPRADGGVLGGAAHGTALEPHEPAALEAPQRGEVLAGDPRRPDTDASSAVWRSVSPSGGPIASAHHAMRAFAPGCGETSESPRAGVEQYSTAIQPASSTRSTGSSASSTSRGSTSRSSATSDSSAIPTTTPSTSRWPNGTTSIDPTPTPSGRR